MTDADTVRDALTYMPPEEWQRYDLATLALDRLEAELDQAREMEAGTAEVLREPSVTAACKHSTCPTGYVAWHEWAERKARTHEQHRCPACGLWAIWRRKVAEEDA